MRRFPARRDLRSTLFASLLFLTATAGATVLVQGNAADGFLWDVSLAVRAARFPPAVRESDVAVVAVDAGTLESPDFAQLPRALFAPYWTSLLSGLADARAIGFDIIFAYSANRLVPDYERNFLAALGHLRSKTVLARSLSALPAEPFLYAVEAFADDDAVAAIELRPDADDVIRRIEGVVRSPDGTEIPSFVGAVLRRAGHADVPAATILMPPRHLEAIPTYALADVLKCIDERPAAARAAFAGKIVLIGTTLPDEERKIASGRFVGPADAGPAPGLGACGLRPLAATDTGAGRVPGVHVHAAGLEAIHHGFAARALPIGAVIAVAVGSGAAGLAAGFTLAPFGAALVAFVGLLLLAAVELAGAAAGLWVPVGAAMGALVAAVPVALAVRSVQDGRLQRRIKAAFSRYLSTTLVEDMMRGTDAPAPGGALCEVTVMFADLSGYTALSDRIPPERLIRIGNAYLEIMADEVEAAGGYVDKFIGDAIMALWNAPVADPDHAYNAVRAAMRMRTRIEAFAAAARAGGEPGLSVKISINTGPAVVGNVGSARRLNYTATGRTVNVAARLERAGREFGAAIVLTEETARRIAGRIATRRLGDVGLRDLSEAVLVHEPLDS